MYVSLQNIKYIIKLNCMYMITFKSNFIQLQNCLKLLKMCHRYLPSTNYGNWELQQNTLNFHTTRFHLYSFEKKIELNTATVSCSSLPNQLENTTFTRLLIHYFAHLTLTCHCTYSISRHNHLLVKLVVNGLYNRHFLLKNNFDFSINVCVSF